MSKTLIVTSHIEHSEKLTLDYSAFGTVICADGGLVSARRLKITPTLLIGDYDSCPMPDSDVIKLPTEKDMTDSEAAIDLAVSRRANDITVLGGLGGRFDHTMGNIGMLAKYSRKSVRLVFLDGQNCVFMITPGSIRIPKNTFKYLGIISYGDCAENVTLRGVKYPLTNHFLTNETSLGVSNEITEDAAQISFTSGRLLVILSNDIIK